MTRMITDPDELEQLLVPIMQREGFGIPQRGCYVAAVEFDEAGDVLTYQLLQNALFLEGMYARDGRSHLLSVHQMAVEHAKQLGATSVMTLTKTDEQGERIGRCAKRLGYEQMPLKIYRRTL